MDSGGTFLGPVRGASLRLLACLRLSQVLLPSLEIPKDSGWDPPVTAAALGQVVPSWEPSPLPLGVPGHLEILALCHHTYPNSANSMFEPQRLSPWSAS